MSRALVPPNVIVERSGAGETYIINEKGEKLIAASRRPDGSIRKAIKIRPGFMPLEERERFVSRGTAFRREVDYAKAHPPGTTEDMLQVTPKKSRKKKSSKKPPQQETFFEIVEETQARKVSSEETPDDAAVTDDGKEKNEASEAHASTTVAIEVVEAPQDLESLEKRLKLTRRKLNEAKVLQRRQDAGQQLLPNQEEKITRIPNFEEELRIVEAKISALHI